jgi:hypothetical protein
MRWEKDDEPRAQATPSLIGCGQLRPLLDSTRLSEEPR